MCAGASVPPWRCTLESLVTARLVVRVCCCRRGLSLLLLACELAHLLPQHATGLSFAFAEGAASRRPLRALLLLCAQVLSLVMLWLCWLYVPEPTHMHPCTAFIDGQAMPPSQPESFTNPHRLCVAFAESLQAMNQSSPFGKIGNSTP